MPIWTRVGWAVVSCMTAAVACAGNGTPLLGALDKIRMGASGLGVSAAQALHEVEATLRCGDSVKVRVVVFVGGFEGNAFAAGEQDGRYRVAIPVEAGVPARSMIHEMTHAVQRGGCAQFAGSGRSMLGDLVVTEGLAMRVVQRLLPGHDDGYYTAAAPDWLAQARARRVAILLGIHDHLADTGSTAAQRFTFGTGTTGLHREAYYAGWVLVGTMLDRLGMSLHDVAVVDPREYPALIERSIAVLSPQ